MSVPHGRGKPTENGLYVAEIYWGWKLLEFKDGEWWHTQCVGRWVSGDPVQWVGPLPEFRPLPEHDKPAAEYDL